MFAIAFDMDIKELRNSYGEPYNKDPTTFQLQTT